MKVLIVESRTALCTLWRRHIERMGATVWCAAGQGEAARLLCVIPFDAMVLDLEIAEGSAVALADFASYRRPDCSVIFVTRRTFFSDGNIFNLFSNVRAYLPAATDPDDIAALVEHCATTRLS
ncbi:response regulator transcription factor [Roseivivax isoporae]|uniref:Chemotaxis protein CheY n=1 Tax=Roseivivax isoporae LMG 25204 TaxID=1449351 RepID=X7F787_9RHOB|nr:response regulator transcription factor [Roseivivax isoporae]ETX27961.1 chemotaxis protein CheY [Roseivivax isoporae LMG 25204]